MIILIATSSLDGLKMDTRWTSRITLKELAQEVKLFVTLINESSASFITNVG
jgi:hypothetical protein